MKTILLLIFGFMITFACFAKEHNDLSLVPRGSFKVQDANVPRTLSIDNFWMSNEITNKEFREFFTQIKNSPDDSLAWLDISGMRSGKTNKPRIVKVAYSAILDQLMDEAAWKTVVETGDYFTHPKYDNYPVVGVTFNGAKYYCIWRTKEENKNSKLKKKDAQIDYRLPTSHEWDYASTFAPLKSSNHTTKALHQVKEGAQNKLGLFNLNGNVAEWTSTSDSNDQYKVVKGSSWKSGSNKARQEIVKANKAKDYIGFRIVRSELAYPVPDEK